jgi:hypothetical protein
VFLQLIIVRITSKWRRREDGRLPEDAMRVRYVIGLVIYGLALAGLLAAWAAHSAGALT